MLISTHHILVAHKNAFLWDAYHPLVDCIPACTAQGGLHRGVSGRGGVYLGVSDQGCLPRGVCLWSVGGGCILGCSNGADIPPGTRGRNPPCGQTDTCETITFINFVCGW